MIKIFRRIEDMTDPDDPQGRTYREVNAEKQHSIPLGTLVEIRSGERLRVMRHTRDCDQTPLYSIGMAGDEEAHIKWRHRQSACHLTVVTPNVSPEFTQDYGCFSA